MLLAEFYNKAFLPREISHLAVDDFLGHGGADVTDVVADEGETDGHREDSDGGAADRVGQVAVAARLELHLWD